MNYCGCAAAKLQLASETVPGAASLRRPDTLKASTPGGRQLTQPLRGRNLCRVPLVVYGIAGAAECCPWGSE